MGQVISTNVQAIRARHNANSSMASIARGIERLSSGQRINTARDDSAGMTIASKMTSQIRGNGMAHRNVMDGISMARTADTAIGGQVEMLQRMRELSVQAANGILGVGDLSALNKEFTSLKDEVNKLAMETEFNGHNLLNAIGSGSKFLSGYSWQWMSDHQVASNGNGGAMVVDSNGDKVDSYHSHTDSGNLANIKQQYRSELEAEFNTSIDNIEITNAGACSSDGAVNPQGIGLGPDYIANEEWVDSSAINDHDEWTTGSMNTADIGNTYKVNYYSIGAHTITAKVDGIEGVDIQIGGNNGDDLFFKFANTTVDRLGLSDSSLDSMDEAIEAIEAIDEALSIANTARGSMGGYENRFAGILSGLNTNNELLSISKSRIMDTDFAVETSNLTKNQILHQAGIAMLAQSNSIPEQVLSLLK